MWAIPFALAISGISDAQEVTYLKYGTEESEDISIEVVKWKTTYQLAQDDDSLPSMRSLKSFELESDFKDELKDKQLIQINQHESMITLITKVWYGRDQSFTFELKSEGEQTSTTQSGEAIKI